MLKHPLRRRRRFLGCRRPSPFLRHGLGGGVPSGVTPLNFYEKGVKTGDRMYLDDVLQGVFSGQKWVFQQDSAPAHKAKTTQDWLRGTFWPLSAPRIGPRGVQTSTPWTINRGLFWRTWLAESVTTTWTV